MANEQNLRPIRSKNEAREKGRKGGIASGKARRELKTLREIVKMELAEPKMIKENGEIKEVTKAVWMAKGMIDKAAHGDSGAANWVRDTAGEKPVEITQNLEPVKIFDDVDLQVKKPKSKK